MKRFGQILIAIGFLEGALVSVLHETEVAWGYLAIGLGLGVVGVLLIHLGARKKALEVRASGAGITELETYLSRVVDGLAAIEAERDRIHTHDVRIRIDEDLREPLAEFAQEREAVSHVYGLQSYADLMNHFAAAERYLNRAWTASADGYVDEVNAFIPRAHAEFSEALRLLQSLRSVSR